jgi:hypothetical protein
VFSSSRDGISSTYFGGENAISGSVKRAVQPLSNSDAESIDRYKDIRIIPSKSYLAIIKQK